MPVPAIRLEEVTFRGQQALIRLAEAEERNNHLRWERDLRQDQWRRTDAELRDAKAVIRDQRRYIRELERDVVKVESARIREVRRERRAKGSVGGRGG